MIPQELDELIKEYLTDGLISMKERMVLLKKAEKMGLDVDEINLYIDAQQQKMDQKLDAAASMKRGKTCPFCGAPVPQLAEKCPECGQNITAEASEELKEILTTIEKYLVEVKAGKLDEYQRNKAQLESAIRKAKLYYSNNEKVANIVNALEVEINIVEKKISRRKISEFVKNHKILSSLIGIVVLYLVLVISFCYIIPDYTMHGGQLLKKVRVTIAEGNIEQAEAYAGRYRRWGTDFVQLLTLGMYDDHQYDKYKQACSELGTALWNAGRLEEATRYKECYKDELASKYWELGNKEKASKYSSDYKKQYAKELWESGEYEKACDNDYQYYNAYFTILLQNGEYLKAVEYADCDENKAALFSIFVQIEDYESAAKLYKYSDDEKKLHAISRCVDDMSKKGKLSEARIFIDIHSAEFASEEDHKKYPNSHPYTCDMAKEILMQSISGN